MFSDGEEPTAAVDNRWKIDSEISSKAIRLREKSICDITVNADMTYLCVCILRLKKPLRFDEFRKLM